MVMLMLMVQLPYFFVYCKCNGNAMDYSNLQNSLSHASFGISQIDDQPI